MGWDTGVVLEDKDFFTVGPDRGFDKSMVFVEDFACIYNVKPTKQALANSAGSLYESRIPRMGLDNNSVFFFRAATFVSITRNQQQHRVYGIAIATNTQKEKDYHF